MRAAYPVYPSFIKDDRPVLIVDRIIAREPATTLIPRTKETAMAEIPPTTKRDIVKKMGEALFRRDWEQFKTFLADDILFKDGGLPERHGQDTSGGPLRPDLQDRPGSRSA